MRFIVVGAGRVGLRTARSLEESGHEVVVVEPDDTAASRARDEGFALVQGDGSTEETLVAAGVEETDAVGALTGDLNTNFATCMIAKHFGCRTVMRIDEDYREDIYREYADQVDEVVYPERLGAILAKNALLGGNIRAIADVAQELQLVEFTITEASPMEGYSISELELPANSRLLAYGTAEDDIRLPSQDDTLTVGDRLVVLAEFEHLADVRSIVVGETGRKAVGGV